MRGLSAVAVLALVGAGCSREDAGARVELNAISARLIEDVAPADAGATSPGAATSRSDAGSPPSEPLEPALPGQLHGVDAGAPSEPEAPADAGSSNEPEVTLPEVVAAAALPIHALWGDEVLSEVELYARLAAERGVCFGETHDSPEDHYAEARALLALSRLARDAGRPFASGFEMFQRPYQVVLDAYVAGTISDAELIIQSEYDERWGLDFDFYRALLERARLFQFPALALNARDELTRKIGRTGLASLDATERAELPELDLDDPEHVAYIYGLFGVLPGHESESGLGNYYAAQTVWDETMASTAATWLDASATGAQIVLFAGSVHCHRSAIPRRVARRTGVPVVALLPILASDLALYPELTIGYDVVVVLEDE